MGFQTAEEYAQEMRTFFSVSKETSIEVDHSEDGIFQINFNITIPALSCEFAAVDVRNVIGKKRENIKDKTIHKFSLDGTWQGSATDLDQTEHLYQGTNKDHYGNQRHAIELNADSFQEGIDEYEVLLVDFHAPWCSHCANLAPIYEHAAELVKLRAPHEIDSHHRHSVALATVDCTMESNRYLCHKHHIQAFPTILVFRQSQNKETGQTYRGSNLHESYTGVREAEAIATFALKVLKEVIEDDKELQAGEGTDSTGDGVAESKLRTRGCRIQGFLNVQRVPGQITIHPYSTGHDFNTGLFSMDHFIDHLSFGGHKPSKVREQRTTQSEGAYAEPPGRPVVLAEGEDVVGFVAPGDGTHFTHEHYIKVVSTSLYPLHGPPIHAFEYTINSNNYEAKDDVPMIVFTYDLSPLKVIVKETTRPWIDGITSMCAILGGVFTCTIIFEGILSRTILNIAKKLD